MAIFKNQIEDLAGTIPATADGEQFLTEGVVDVVHRMKALHPQHLPLFAKEEDITDSGLAVHDTNLLDVRRELKVCRLIHSSGRHGAVDATSINYAPASDPIYYFLNGKVFIRPTGGSASCSIVQNGVVTSWDSSSSSITYMPEDNYFQVVMYAAMQVLHHKMVVSTMPTDLTLETIPSLSVSVTLPTVPTLVTLTYVPPALGTINTVSYSAPGVLDVSSISDVLTTTSSGLSAAPAYNSGSIIDVDTSGITVPVVPVSPALLSFSSFSGISDLSITVISPTVPSLPSFTTPDISSVSLQPLASAPVYTAPSITSTAGSPDDLTDMIDSDWTALDFDFDDENIDFATWFQTAGAMIQNQEDIELASMQLQKIAAYVNSYGVAMQNRLNQFNDANVEYQASIQTAVQNAQIAAQEAQAESNLLLQKENQEYGAKLGRYQAEVGEYSQKVNTEIGQYTQNLGKAIQSWSTEQQNQLGLYGANLQRYQAELADYSQKVQRLMGEHAQKMQDHMNLFNDANAEYQATLQKGIQDAQQDNSVKLANMQKDLQIATSNEDRDMQRQMQNAIQTMQAIIADNGNVLAKYQAEMQNASQAMSDDGANNQNKLAKYQAELGSYQQEVGKEMGEYTQNMQNIGQKNGTAIQDYGARIQKVSGEYQWLQGQLGMVAQQYNQSFMAGPQ